MSSFYVSVKIHINFLQVPWEVVVETGVATLLEETWVEVVA
jgi:hypothetical protein